MTTKINLSGISELDFTNGIASASNTNDVTTITLSALGVTSVGLTAPTEFNVANSPVTTSGTIALTWTTETANFVFAGPTSGGAATPGFRALVAADIPALAYVTGSSLTAGQLIVGAGSSAIAVGNLSGDVTTSGSAAATVVKLRGASLDATIGTAGAGQDGYVIYWDNSSASYKLKVITSSSGTVTSVSLTAPAEITVGGSPITTSGTIALTWATESANKIFAGPTSGGAATPTFRSMVAADIANISSTAGTGWFFGPTGVQAIAGGAGVTISAVANQISGCMVIVPYAITIRKVSIDVTTLSAANTANFAIYSADGTTKLIDASVSVASTGSVTATLGSAVVLAPGVYLYAYASTSTVGQASEVTVPQINTSAAQGALQRNATRGFTGTTNALSGTTMPPSLGTLTQTSGQTKVLALFES